MVFDNESDRIIIGICRNVKFEKNPENLCFQNIDYTNIISYELKACLYCGDEYAL